MHRWLARVGVQTLFIAPGSPWENGYNESLNGKLRDEFLNGEIFYTLSEAIVLVEQWRRLYNTDCPASHSATSRRTTSQPCFIDTCRILNREPIFLYRDIGRRMVCGIACPHVCWRASFQGTANARDCSCGRGHRLVLRPPEDTPTQASSDFFALSQTRA